VNIWKFVFLCWGIGSGIVLLGIILGWWVPN
jgi:hypothetical protein